MGEWGQTTLCIHLLFIFSALFFLSQNFTENIMKFFARMQCLLLLICCLNVLFLVSSYLVVNTKHTSYLLAVVLQFSPLM